MAVSRSVGPLPSAAATENSIAWPVPDFDGFLMVIRPWYSGFLRSAHEVGATGTTSRLVRMLITPTDVATQPPPSARYPAGSCSAASGVYGSSASLSSAT